MKLGDVYFVNVCCMVSGLLQLQFLSGAIKRPICPHYELYQEVSQYSLHPCPCIDVADQYDQELHVMWVTMEDGGPLNHIIPLLPRRENRGGQ